MKFRSLYFIMLNKEIRRARLVYTRPWTLKVSCRFFTTMESLPLKKLDFGLQKPTGPSSGVVASIVWIIIALSFFYTTHTPFRLYWVNYKILVLRTTIKKILKIRIVVVQKIIKNPNLVIKL